MLMVSCKDVSIECDFIGRANSEDELIMQLLGHIVKGHRSNMAEIMKPEIREKIRANIRKS
jgi:predicted small metal-binding protein